jgi:Protein of unknown function (DUF3987)
MELAVLAERLGATVGADNTVVTTHFGCGARLVLSGRKHLHKAECDDCGVIAQSRFFAELDEWEKARLAALPETESPAIGAAVAANGHFSASEQEPEAEPEPEPSVAANHTSTRPKRPPEPWWQHIPNDLTVMPHWVVWTYAQNGKKWTKVPQQPDGSPASSTDPTTWSSFEDVRNTYRASGDKFDGVGLVVTESDPFVGFDFDHVFDRRGTLDPTVKGFIDELASYTEVSPSGHGVRVFVRGKLPEKDRKLGDFECYESGRYLTLTGDRLLDSPTGIRECQEAIESVHAAIFAERTAKRVAKPKNTDAALVSDSDAEQLERARNSKGCEKFIALYDRGDWKGAGYPSRSEAELALCRMLRFWVGADTARIDALFRRSGLYREKWDRDDYRERTINEALPGDVFGPHFHADREILQRTHDEPFLNGHDQQMAKTSGDEWPEPQPLPGGLPAVPYFDECLLPDALRPWIVDIADRAQAPLDFPAAGAIVALSSAIARRLGIQPKRKDDWLVVPNLWGFIVGPPGFLKSPMLHEVLKPLARLEARAREEHERAFADYELQREASQAERKRLTTKFARAKSESTRDDLTAQLRELESKPPSRRRYIVNDPTVEKLGEIPNQNPGGVLLARDEVAGFLATMERAGHENDRAFYLEAWNGYSSYSYDRIGRGTLDIEAACVSILGAITPGPLGAYLRETFSGGQDDGLIQRFQVGVYPDPPISWRNVDRLPNVDARRQAFEVFERLAKLDMGSVSSGSGPQGGEIPSLRFNEEAQDFFDCWRADLEARFRDPDEHPVMVSHLSKYRSLMPSLALIFHACDCVAAGTFGPVTLESTKRAAAFCGYLEPRARRIYHGVVARADTTTRLLGEKIKACKLSTPFTARDVYRSQWAGLNEPTDVAGALEALEDLGWLKAETTPPPTFGGRPTKRYHVNPRIAR